MPCYIAVGRLVDVGCSSRCILRRSSYISETLLLVLLKLLFIVWLFPVGHLWSNIVLKKQHETKNPKTLFTLNPGIPGGPGGPEGQIAGHCRVQRQNTETSTASVCREHIFSFLQSHHFHKKHLPEALRWDHEVYREDPEKVNNDNTSEKYDNIYFKCDFAAFFVFSAFPDIHWVTGKIWQCAYCTNTTNTRYTMITVLTGSPSGPGGPGSPGRPSGPWQTHRGASG